VTEGTNREHEGVRELLRLATSTLHDRVRANPQGATLPERLDGLWEAGVQASPNVIPRLGMDWGNVTDIDAVVG
jgi:hypothetical protein